MVRRAEPGVVRGMKREGMGGTRRVGEPWRARAAPSSLIPPATAALAAVPAKCPVAPATTPTARQCNQHHQLRRRLFLTSASWGATFTPLTPLRPSYSLAASIVHLSCRPAVGTSQSSSPNCLMSHPVHAPPICLCTLAFFPLVLSTTGDFICQPEDAAPCDTRRAIGVQGMSGRRTTVSWDACACD